MSFDIVICVGPKDNDIVNSVIPFTKKNIIGYRNIYLICQNPAIYIDDTIIIDEMIFPFNIDDVAKILGNRDRNGWYLQQLLKLYAGFIIPDILEKYLVIDCDTHFLKPTRFLTDDNKCILTTGTEYHIPYFEHMNRLHPSLSKLHHLSGISHHTFFDSSLVKLLMEMVEQHHISSNKPFWKIYLDEIAPQHYDYSGAAENEIYFIYVLLYHPEKIETRELNWNNSNVLDLNTNYDFTSVHWYMRN